MSSQDRDRDRDRGGFRRRRRRGGPIPPAGRKEREYETENVPQAKPTIILAKPNHDQAGSSSSPASSSIGSKTPEKTVMMRSRGEDSSAVTTVPTSSGETTPSPSSIHSIQRNPTSGLISSDSPNRLAPPPEMTRCVKLVDESQTWNDSVLENLVDQTDFFVVGVIGLQGTGKSTVMSLLAGNSMEDSHRQYMFQPQSRETRELCEHQTNGIDMFVTGERVIFLDTQPVISASVLDRLIRHDKKIAAEYTTAENCIEMQSLQQSAFLMSVCHVVIVVQDWFSDISFLRFLQTAEMLKPSCPSSNHDSNSNADDTSDYFPNVVFLYNKSSRDDLSVETYTSMIQTLSKVFENSKLKIRGSVTMATSKLLPGLKNSIDDDDVNLFLLPHMDSTKDQGGNGDTILTLLPEYRGYPSFTCLVNGLRQQMYNMQQDQLTHTTLSEKNWFHYAARMWDAVKKSQLMAEYNRLLH